MSEDQNKPNELESLKRRATILGIPFSNNIGLDTLRERVNAKLNEQKDAPAQASALEQGDDAPDMLDEEQTKEAVSEKQEETAEEELIRIRAELAEAKRVAAESEATLLRSLNANPQQINPLAGGDANVPQPSKLTVRQQAIREAMKLVRCRITNLDPKKKDLQGEILAVGNRYIGTVKKFIPYGDLTEDGFHIPKVLYDELDSRRFLHIQTKRNKENGQIEVKTSYAKEFSLEVLPQLSQEELNRLAAAQSAASANS